MHMSKAIKMKEEEKSIDLLRLTLAFSAICDLLRIQEDSILNFQLSILRVSSWSLLKDLYTGQ